MGKQFYPDKPKMRKLVKKSKLAVNKEHIDNAKVWESDAVFKKKYAPEKPDYGKPYKKSKIRYSFFVRHGERGDYDEALKAKYIDSADPILTKVGHKQAAETGQFLKKYL